jgi:hypothetical protein
MGKMCSLSAGRAIQFCRTWSSATTAGSEVSHREGIYELSSIAKTPSPANKPACKPETSASAFCRRPSPEDSHERLDSILSEFEYLFPSSNRPPSPGETGVLQALELSEIEQKCFDTLRSEDETNIGELAFFPTSKQPLTQLIRGALRAARVESGRVMGRFYGQSPGKRQ